MNKNESKYFNTALKMDNALIFLLNEKEFEYITIKDVCRVAKVNRSTFYLHYQNTYDLLEEIIKNLTNSYHEHLVKNNKNKFNINGKLDDLYFIKDSFLIPYLEFIKENKNVYKALKNNPSIFHANATYQQMFNNIFSPIMSKFGLKKELQNYMMDYYMQGLSSIMLNWVNDDCKISIEDLAKFIEGIIGNHVKKD